MRFVLALACGSLACASLEHSKGAAEAGQSAGESERVADAAPAPQPDAAARPNTAAPQPDATAAPRADAVVAQPDAAAPRANAAAIAPPPAGAMPSQACGAGMAAPVGYQTVANKGKDRRFIVRPPTAYDASRPYPLLFAFSGAEQTAASDFDRNYGFRTFFADKAVVVIPEAIADPSGYVTWMRDAADDLAFFDAMIAWLKTRVCFDPSRIFSTGVSSGGYFSNTLGCQRGNVLRAVAPVAGGWREIKNCVNTVAVWQVIGSNDPGVNDAVRVRDFWLQRNGCTAMNPTPVSPSPCVAYQDCRTGYPVQWCLWNGPHGWWTSANAGMWSFFMGLPSDK
jgi:poly(3-hydroxybutyrate) depolymerase